jgi:hypothetical protein
MSVKLAVKEGTHWTMPLIADLDSLSAQQRERALLAQELHNSLFTTTVNVHADIHFYGRKQLDILLCGCEWIIS